MAPDLERFRDAQRGGVHEQALSELRAGRKRSHWIWYVLPQLEGLGRSGTSRTYAIRGRAEAESYLADELLRGRLAEIVAAMEEQLVGNAAKLEVLMGGELDATKAVSSLTLFEAVAEPGSPLHTCCTSVLDAAASQGFARCAFTLARL